MIFTDAYITAFFIVMQCLFPTDFIYLRERSITFQDHNIILEISKPHNKRFRLINCDLKQVNGCNWWWSRFCVAWISPSDVRHCPATLCTNTRVLNTCTQVFKSPAWLSYCILTTTSSDVWSREVRWLLNEDITLFSFINEKFNP